MNAITIGNAPWKEYADSIQHLRIEAGIANFTDGAGADLPNLQDVTIGKDVTDIEPRAFINSSAITRFEVADTNKTFYTDEYYHVIFRKDELSNGRKYVTLVRAAVESMRNYAIPDAVNYIAPYAFYGAEKLTRLTIGSGVAAIGDYAFSGCKIKGNPNTDDSVRNLIIPDNVRIIGAHAFEGNSFNTTSFSFNLNTISENAFASCVNLTEITAINNPVMLIEKNAFLNTNIDKGTTPISFNGSSDEWREVVRNEQTLSRLSSTRYSSINPHNTEYIAYDINGGSVFTIPENQNHIKKDQYYNIIEPIDPIKNVDASGNDVYPLHESKYFAGWSTEKLDYVTSGTVLLQPGDTLEKKASVRLYAAWTEKINLVFNANGGELTENLGAVVFDEPNKNYKIPADTPTNKKYNFVGWSKDKNSSEVLYKPGDTLKIDKNTILYAIWNTEGPYDVTIDANGGKLADGNAKKVLSGVKKKGVDYTVIESNPTRDRYEFSGWSVDGGSTTASPVVTNDYNTTVKAVWKFLGPCYIRYYVGNELDESKSQDVAIGETITVGPAGEKSGYKFIGWSANNKIYQPGDKITVDKDFIFQARYQYINPTKDTQISISGNISREIDKGSKVHIIATVTNVPDGYHFWLYQDGEGVTGGPVTGGSATIDWTSDKITEDTKFNVKLIDVNGTIARNDTRPVSAVISVHIKAGFFARLIAFFKGLFGLLPTVEIK